MGRYLLAIDQGTTGTTALVMGLDGQTLGREGREFRQHFPAPGQVEHEPEEIWQSVIAATRGALKGAGVAGADIAAIGITNQRETSLLWERATDRPLRPAIVWQDRRSSPRCAELRARGLEPRVQELTGLRLDPYFSGTKLEWMLAEEPGRAARAARGELCFGTIDSFLVWRLAGGAAAGAPHVTDVTNASRTLLMNLRSRRWEPELCELFGVPPAVLPKIVPSAAVIAQTRGFSELPDGVPITGVAGDQHAALFGQACFEVGDMKCTYGTGAFALVNVGAQPRPSASGLLSTVAWQIGDEVTYGLEGSCFVAGAAVQWLRDGLGILQSSAEIEALARSVESTDGVVFVPALAGLGAPYWDADVRGAILGLTRGSTRAHIARATLESIALEVEDLMQAMAADLGQSIQRLRVDGGAAANDLLLQLQSDYSRIVVERPMELESTARGAAMLAGVGAGLLRPGADAERLLKLERRFEPALSEAARQAKVLTWHEAIGRLRSRA